MNVFYIPLLLLVVFGVSLLLFYRYYKRRLKNEVRRAQRSEQLKSVFLANVSRALRTPLNAIQGYSNFILDEKNETMQPEQIKELASNINSSSQQLLDFISQLLELSSFEGSMPSFTFIEVNLAELMASYRREALMSAKPDTTIRVRTELSPHCKVTLDTNFMHQLMMHLLTNATRHASQGDILISYANERKGLKVSISYMGIGQSEVIGEDIYSYLQREDALTRTNATAGLGIAFCKAIIDALGGELDIEIENNKKTVTSFWFPCRMVDRRKGV